MALDRMVLSEGCLVQVLQRLISCVHDQSKRGEQNVSVVKKWIRKEVLTMAEFAMPRSSPSSKKQKSMFQYHNPSKPPHANK